MILGGKGGQWWLVDANKCFRRRLASSSHSPLDPAIFEWSSRSFFYLHHVMEAAAPEESDVDAQRQRLERLQKIKSTKCLCSRCGAKLKYASFTAHPCFKQALLRYGKYEARMRVYRVSSTGQPLGRGPLKAIGTGPQEQFGIPPISVIIHRDNASSLKKTHNDTRRGDNAVEESPNVTGRTKRSLSPSPPHSSSSSKRMRLDELPAALPSSPESLAEAQDALVFTELNDFSTNLISYSFLWNLTFVF